MLHSVTFRLEIIKYTGNDQRLRSAGDNDRRSKRFIALTRFFHVTDDQNTRGQITRI